ncbi:MAG: cupin domain-containing protein [Chloroflexi bacterium]|nr:cupin domain-containing protein [Chloroflexota bacterium]
MQIIKALNAPDGPNPHGVSVKPLHASEHTQVVMVTLGPGEGLRSHRTPVDVFFYVLEGSGEVEIGDERATVERDDLIVSPARVPHRVMNPSSAPMRFLIVKTPAQP